MGHLLLRNMWERRRNIVLERKTKVSAQKFLTQIKRNLYKLWRSVENRKQVAYRSRLRKWDKKIREYYAGDYLFGEGMVNRKNGPKLVKMGWECPSMRHVGKSLFRIANPSLTVIMQAGIKYWIFLSITKLKNKKKDNNEPKTLQKKFLIL